MTHYSQINLTDIANGPGVRVTIFFSGCTHHCKGCFNEETWDFNHGDPFTQETIDYILNNANHDYIEGLTLLGGDPLCGNNPEASLDLCKQFKQKFPNKTIWCFTGYLFDKDILSGKLGDWEITREYLGLLDVLVDGPYVEARRNLSLRFRGSENQRIINVPASLSSGTVVLWEDWQGDRKGMI